MGGRRSFLRWLAVLTAAVGIAALWVPTALAGYVVYLQNVYLSAGHGDSTSGYAPRNYNWVEFDNPFGGLPQMGTTYCPQVGDCYSWRWSNTGSLYDDRTISYGKAACVANWGNNYSVYLYWCETSN